MDIEKATQDNSRCIIKMQKDIENIKETTDETKRLIKDEIQLMNKRIESKIDKREAYAVFGLIAFFITLIVYIFQTIN